MAESPVAACPYFGVTYGLNELVVIVLGCLGEHPGRRGGGDGDRSLAEAFLPPDYSAYKEAVAYTYFAGQAPGVAGIEGETEGVKLRHKSRHHTPGKLKSGRQGSTGYRMYFFQVKR